MLPLQSPTNPLRAGDELGSERERLGLEAGRPWHELADAWLAEEEAFRQRREAFLLYR